MSSTVDFYKTNTSRLCIASCWQVTPQAVVGNYPGDTASLSRHSMQQIIILPILLYGFLHMNGNIKEQAAITAANACRDGVGVA